MVHKTLINILRPVRTFCNVNCTFGTKWFTRPVRTFCNVNCTFGTKWFTSSQDSNKHFETHSNKHFETHPLELFAISQVHKTLINILRPVRTFCNVNCAFGTILFTRL
ncbi:unnamed protein product [Clavelina lepadiformis]|uniref:C2H2-type domain-containing protein n=1 Tax=Clavelina lepadiformis TaxID=159417 RepID=A0ABP0G3U7_CLALP